MKEARKSKKREENLLSKMAKKKSVHAFLLPREIRAQGKEEKTHNTPSGGDI